MQYLAILGRQPKISLAELESQFSDVSVVAGSKNLLATFESETDPEIAKLGGVIKLAKPIDGGSAAPEKFLEIFASSTGFSSKFVIGISDFSKGASARKAQGEALHIKRAMKKAGFSVRVLPNKDAVLSSATVFHNQLGEKPGHFEFIKYGNNWFVGLGVQNIKAYAERDQARPARDAKNGMLPPKLAQILINLCGPLPRGATVLDPFCGTGVVLQEALLMEYKAYGTDLSERIVGFARKNLEWLIARCSLEEYVRLSTGDAQDFQWEQPIDAVAFEGYLGPPMSQAPAEIKLKQVISEIAPLYRNVLRNLSNQLQSGTPVVMAVPAWLRPDGHYQRLNILDEVEDLGYNVLKYKNLSQEDLLYYRDGQVVAREIIVLRKK
ncbi:hypothetical protein J6S39_01095 [Candidatus Saccharibacteria bacterium]|nr:hypothetical protein [Candidatus Saccharibacteria bacterium]